MYTAQEACNYLMVSLDDLEHYLSFGIGRIFFNETGERVFHDNDIEWIAVRTNRNERFTHAQVLRITQGIIVSIDT